MKHKAKRLLALLLTAMVVVIAFPTGAITVSAENTTDFLGGEGTEEKPYLISTKKHLNNVRKYLDAHFLMVTDIKFVDADFAEGGDFYNDGQGWEPIGPAFSQAFSGTFDGDGHTITGLYCNRSGSGTQYAGLFGYNKGGIRYLGMEGGSVAVSCSDHLSIYVGGIAGKNYGTISDCYNTGSVSASGGYLVYVGGITGQNDDTISNCYNTGNVSNFSTGGVGGIVGSNGGEIKDCYNIGNVSASSNGGGIVGENQGAIRNCYNTGDVSNSHSHDSVGGIAGSNGGTINDCYNIGNVSASSDIGNVSASSNGGGIAGENQGAIRNCYNTGNVSYSNNPYNDSVGGIVGSNGDTISNCYYLNTASKGVGNGTDTATKCNIDQMKQRSTFIGFDFDVMWEFAEGNSYSFPTLQTLPYFGEKDNTTEFAGGTGTLYDPYLISTKDHLNNVRKYLGSYFLMVADIEFVDADFAEGGDFYNDGQGWEPIGTNSTQPFFGSFVGGGHTITGLYCKRSDSGMLYFAGLFGYNMGVIHNLGVKDGNILSSSAFSTGGIVGYNGGTISDCYNTGSVSASNEIGGIAGENYGTISGCFNTGSVSASSSAGGIVGRNWGTISDCFNTGSMSAYGEAGGIAGCNSDTISNSYNTGSVSASFVGSIAGTHDITSTISNCYYPDTLSEGYGSSSGTVTKCTIEQMKQKSTFIGFDFDTVWEFVEGNPYPFPTLQAVPYVGEKAEENITEFAGGTGTPYDPYRISTKDHLNNIRKYLDAHFLMVADIAFTEADFAEGGDYYNDGQGWEPIGADATQPFFGSFNAGGHTITGLYCNHAHYAGLFGYSEGVICNLRMDGGNILAPSHAGGIAGYNNGGAISNCYNTNSVLVSAGSNAYAGGIAGYNNGGAISNCYNTGSVSTSAGDNTYAGGIAGYNGGGDISNCYNTSSVSASTGGSAYVGGIVGDSIGTISNCYNTSSVSASADKKAFVGGIAGRNYNRDSAISDCYNKGNVSASADDNACASGIAGYNGDYSVINNCYNTGNASVPSASFSYAGGIAGYNDDHGAISDCYNTGGISASTQVGGIVGYNRGFISNCYNTGSISASTYVGGIVGYNNGVISNCYNTGNVTASSPATNAYGGGIVGVSSGMINNCYYLDAISQGVGNGTDTATKCTAEQMKQQATFIGFDFNTVWEIDSYRNYPYPQLKHNRQEPIQSLELLTPPVNNQVIEGLWLDLTGATVKITYKDGNVVTTDASAQMFSELDVNQIGLQKIHLSYGGQVTAETVDIEVIPKSISSIAVTTPPDKTTYVQGQPLNPVGGKLTVYYNNNTSELVDLAEAQLTYPADQTGKITATAEYQGVTADFIITVTERQVQSISLIEPDKLSYIEGQALDLTGGKLRVIYVSEDNYTEEIPLVSSMIAGYDPNTLGIQPLTVEYAGKKTSFVVRVVQKSLVSIEVTKKPDKLTYLEGEAFDPIGMEVTAFYNNGMSEVVKDYQISGYDSTPGTKTITVTYGSKAADFKVIVNAKLESIEIKRPPEKLVYLCGEPLDMSGAEIIGHYSDGSQKEITEYQISGYNSQQTGKQTITVTSEGKNATFIVEVVAKRIRRLEITRFPDKMEYWEGEELRLDGLVVTAYYTDGSSQEITDYTVSGFDTTPGEKEIVITAQGVSATFTVTVLEGTAPVPGDVNGDDRVNMKDYSLLRQYLSGWDIDIGLVAANVNGDAIVNMKDLSLLRQWLNGWEVEWQ